MFDNKNISDYRNLTNNNSMVAKNLEKLSSGYKINRAGDYVAGLAISEKMRAQITGLETAQKNANDGISHIQTAEGALTEVHSMLNRMVELTNQSANGTYQDDDRVSLQSKVDALNRYSDFLLTKHALHQKYFSSSCIAPFGWHCTKAFEMLDTGNAQGYIHELKTCLNTCIEANLIVEYLLKHTLSLQITQTTISPELSSLAEQVNKLLATYPPDVPTIVTVKASPAYQKVAWIIENK